MSRVGEGEAGRQGGVCRRNCFYDNVCDLCAILKSSKERKDAERR